MRIHLRAMPSPTCRAAMIHSFEFHKLDPSARFFCLARAYLEASTVLCEAMVHEKYRPRFANSRVILHLCHHAFELFLKAAIMTKLPSSAAARTRRSPAPPTAMSRKRSRAPINTHSLYSLYEKYQELFGDPQFKFSMPFGLEATPPFELSPEVASKYFEQLDQRYRYTLDKGLASFPGIEGFLPDSFHAQLQDHRREFDRLIPLITTRAGPAHRDAFT
jgi:hypothetical protein